MVHCMPSFLSRKLFFLTGALSILVGLAINCFISAIHTSECQLNYIIYLLYVADVVFFMPFHNLFLFLLSYAGWSICKRGAHAGARSAN